VNIMDTPDQSRLRISDEDRHRVAEVLREAAGDGRLDFDELDERLEATYAAKTYSDLVPITLDLPGQPRSNLAVPASTSNPVVTGPADEKHVAILGGLDRKGVWVVPQHMTVLCFMGGADLDLTRAQFAAKEVVITINAIMGGAEIKVNPQTHVIMEGTSIMGGYSGPNGVEAELTPDSQVLRIRGFALMGGVNVLRKRAPGSEPRKLRGSGD
jgi:Domain of unknown function (DUF1707)/Cell wall-active antibiotics response 4TMS YvqF